MTSRYETSAMAAVWSDQARYGRWARIEAAVSRALWPVHAARYDAREHWPTPEQVADKEAETGHDVEAFLRAWLENLSAVAPDSARWLHRGLTSSDVVDTSNALAFQASLAVLCPKIDSLRMELEENSGLYADDLRLGRTHGQHAEPTSFGHQIWGWRQHLDRAWYALADATSGVARCKLSGPMGTYAHHVTPAIEYDVARSLGLSTLEVGDCSQVIPRDLYATWARAMVGVVQACEQIATEIRHSSRPEVGELFEGYDDGYTGSSSMPHKQNPTRCERISGVSRLARGHAHAIEESVVLWGDRDISHSSVERVALPGLCHLTDFVVQETLSIVRGWVVGTYRMALNLDQAGEAPYSSYIMDRLLEDGESRDDARAQSRARFSSSPRRWTAPERPPGGARYYVRRVNDAIESNDWEGPSS